jgi:hypothetical protein
MRTTLRCLVVLLVVPHANAAPAPEPGRKANEKLEALKKRLPDVLKTWVKERTVGYPFTYAPTLRRVRLIRAAEAKVVVHLNRVDDDGKVRERPDYMLTAYLSYYNGLWTIVRFESSDPSFSRISSGAVHFLMDAIDEAAEKP